MDVADIPVAAVDVQWTDPDKLRDYIKMYLLRHLITLQKGIEQRMFFVFDISMKANFEP